MAASAIPTLDSYLANITSEHADQPNFVAYVSALVQPLLDAQAFLRVLMHSFDLDTAVGVQLDAVGKWIGRSRFLEQPLAGVYFSLDTTGLGFDQGAWIGPFDAVEGLTALDDATYRQLLYAKRILNSWDGSIPMAATALGQMFNNPNTALMLLDNQDMSQTVGIAGAVPSALLLGILQGGYVPIDPIGVQTNYLITSVNGAPLFGFDIDPETISGFDMGAFAGAPGVGPGQVVGLAPSSVTPTTITLSWLPPTTGTGPYTYQVQMQVGDGTQGIWQAIGLPVSGTTTTVSGLQSGTQYAFKVYAINSGGPGAASGTIIASTLPAVQYLAAGVATIPTLSASILAALTTYKMSAAVNVLPITVAANAILPGAMAGLATLPPITAVGIVARSTAGVATLPPITCVATAGQAGLNFIAGQAQLPSLQASGQAGVGHSIVITSIVNPNSGAGFVVNGILVGFAARPNLYYVDDASLGPVTGLVEVPTTNSIAISWNPDPDPPETPFPSGASVTTTQFSFVHPAIVAGAHTLIITDLSVSTSSTYTSTNPVSNNAPAAPTNVQALSSTSTSITIGFVSP